jgi:hypothetical protein
MTETKRVTEARARQKWVAQGGLRAVRKFLLRLKKSVDKANTAKVPRTRASNEEAIGRQLSRGDRIADEAHLQLRTACYHLGIPGAFQFDTLPSDPSVLAPAVELALRLFPVSPYKTASKVNAMAVLVASEVAQRRDGSISRDDYKSATGDEPQEAKRGGKVGSASVEKNATRLKNAAAIFETSLGRAAFTVRPKPTK